MHAMVASTRRRILGDESEGEADSDAGSEDEDDEESDEEDEEQMKIQDETETSLINLRRPLYLTIMSSVYFEEAGHKPLKIKLEPGQESRENLSGVLWPSGAAVLHDQQDPPRKF